jgi:hypothetical protein
LHAAFAFSAQLILKIQYQYNEFCKRKFSKYSKYKLKKFDHLKFKNPLSTHKLVCVLTNQNLEKRLKQNLIFFQTDFNSNLKSKGEC